MDFKITSKFAPTGDQPEAISQLTDGILQGDRAQVLLGVTGSGKTFTSQCHSQHRTPHPYTEPQQDSCRTAVRGDEELFPSKRC